MPHEDIAVTGIAGRFPNADNLREFAYNLYNKVDMIDGEETRWKNFNERLPQRCGKVRNIDKFDTAAFRVNGRQANSSDPQFRILIEHCYEAILDAGISPRTLQGSNTGVFVGCSSSDAKENHVYHRQFTDGTLVANNKYVLSNGVSFALGLNGPSLTVDTACSASGYALDVASNYIRNGSCDAALVCGTQLNLCPEITFGYVVSSAGALSKQGLSRPFDEGANGFVRAETICAVFLQKTSDAKRLYAQLVYTKSNNDGFKTEGFYFPSKHLQKKLLTSFYKDIKIDPNTVNYVEAHATGTIAGDPQESWAIDKVFCETRKTTLPIGSVKSNIGHAESASTVASLAKVVLTFENQMIPPNINLTTVRSEIEGLIEGRLRVVTEPEPLSGPLIALNSFGINGANAHLLLKGNLKKKINNGIPSDNLGRLLLWAGRTTDAVNFLFDDIESRNLDAEHIALLQNSQVYPTLTHQNRGYAVFEQDRATGKAVCIKRDVQQSNVVNRPIVFMYSGVGSQWPQMGAGLMKVPIFASAIEKCHAILKTKNFDLKKLLTSSDKTIFDDVLNTFIGIIAVQIGLTDVLKAVGIEPDHIIGHSVGELGCAYGDKSLTLEETILAAFARGTACKEAKVIDGRMAVVGKSLDELKQIKPEDIDIACHNSPDLYTISGPSKSVENFVAKLSSEQVFARNVVSPLPFHSRYIAGVGPLLRSKLEKIIPKPKARSPKWLSSCIPQDEWDNPESKLSSASYHTRNLLSPVLFSEVCQLLPENSILIEISPHGLLKAVVKKSMATSTHIGLTQKDCENSSLFLSEALGKLFQNGVEMDVSKLYPAVNFPVSIGTPMISPVIKWDHSDTYMVPFYDSMMSGDRRRIPINLMDPRYAHFRGHMIDGKIILPGMGYVFLVWETFAMMNGLHFTKAKIQIDDLKLLRATTLSESNYEILTITILRGENKFAVLDGSTAVATGSIRLLDASPQLTKLELPAGDNFTKLTNEDFQKISNLKGYNYSGIFNSLTEIRSDGNYAKIKWEDDWTAFLDAFLQIDIVRKHPKKLELPRAIRKIVIDPEVTLQMINEADPENILIEAIIDRNVDTARGAGVEICGLESFTANRFKQKVHPVLESYKFVPHFTTPELSPADMAKFCIQLIQENARMTSLKLVEFDAEKEPISSHFYAASGTTPLVSVEANFLTSKEELKIENVTVHNDAELATFNDANVVIDLRVVDGKGTLQTIQKLFEGSCFVICRELKQSSQFWDAFPLFRCIANVKMGDEIVDMIHYNPKRVSFDSAQLIVEITDEVDNFGWIQKVQDVIAAESKLILFSQRTNQSGVLGLANCLFREPNGHNLTCVFIDDEKATKFNPENPFYKKQLSLGLKMNVLRNGKWGSYRHMALDQSTDKKHANCLSYADALAIGDFSKFTWMKRIDSSTKQDLIEICFAPLNFRDVMVMSGKIANFAMKNTLKQMPFLGLEFSGLLNGKRVMGVKTTPGAMASHVKTREVTYWDVPDKWTLEEASTIPIVYATVYLAFFHSCDIRKGKNILIHAGSGGVGIGAIHVALAYGLEVFTTVSTEEKKKFLLETFPSLKVENIGNSRDLTFEKMVMHNTKGRGVDFVLNSLSEEKLRASLRCVAEDGFFLEIGKYDMAVGSLVSLSYFKNGISFKPVLFGKKYHDVVLPFFRQDTANGIIKPLKATVFKSNQVEQAFRLLASGKHIGKVIVDVRNVDESDETPKSVTYQQFFNKDLCHIIVGGLGGFGLELAEWLIQRGAKKIVLNSKRGITSTYQSYKINHWRSYKINIVVNTLDSTTREGCKLLIKRSSELGEIGGIWNLAVNLSDGMFVSQNEETFTKCFRPKVHATINLNELSQQMCPKLKHFVAFSSVSCGFGNPGQTNYAMANSIIERIVEKRRSVGLPGKVIQWGPIGDVGVAATANLTGVLKLTGIDIQPIESCIQVLDQLLIGPDPIVSSLVAAKTDAFGGGKKSAKEIVLHLLGIKDTKNISDDAVLGDLGIDSLVTVEVSQILARDYDVRLTTEEVKHLKLSQLESLAKKSSGSNQGGDFANVDQLISSSLINGVKSDKLIIQLPSAATAGTTSKVLIIPSSEGYIMDAWKTLATNLKHKVYFLQYETTWKHTSFDEIVTAIHDDVTKVFEDVDNFLIVGHSFGCVLALKFAEIFESKKKFGKVINVDGSPLFVHHWTNFFFPTDTSDENVKQIIATGYARKYLNNDAALADVMKQKTFDLQIKKMIEYMTAIVKISSDQLLQEINWMINRIKISSHTDKLSFAKLQKTSLILLKAETEIIKDQPQDYGLQQYSAKEVFVHTLEGDHSTIIQNKKLLEIVSNEASFLTTALPTQNLIETRTESKRNRHQGNVHV